MTKELVRQKFVRGELTPREFLRQLSELLCEELRMNGEQREFEFEFLAEGYEPDVIRCRGVLRKRREVSREEKGRLEMMTREEVLKEIRASLQRSIRQAYEEDGRAFTERDLSEAEYTILSELARSHLEMRHVKPVEVSREICGNG